MKYFVLSFVLAVVAAAPAPQAPYNPYYGSSYGGYGGYAGYGGYTNPGAYNPNVYNPYRSSGYHPQGQYYQPQPYHHGQYAAPAVAETRESRPDGSFQYSYATADGQQVQAEGFLRAHGPGVEVPVITGSYSYTSPDGTPVSVKYIADEYGFRAQGPHIANAEAIDRSVALNIESERYQHGPVGPIHK